NQAWNCGAEGETTDEGILELRARQMRNLWCTLLLSQGVPMISGGDELARTQRGNNNAYCQDNEITWQDWTIDPSRQAFFEFARKVVHWRRQHPNFRRRSFYETDSGRKWQAENLQWYRIDGEVMSESDWQDGTMRMLAMYLRGDAPEIRDAEGRTVVDWDFLLVFNSHHEAGEFRLPKELAKRSWKIVFDTNRPKLSESGEEAGSDAVVPLAARSFVLLGHG
ncbi:MAG TPA: hypothetical protein VFJ90_17000, partial [Candidatus Didemnitutus sp.]|nr:hypothetical protein [Candidatus Didemnitutus sp.]